MTSHIRNFAIIAHIDHGKSTLADRLLEATGAVQQRNMRAQVLDDMELEQERGITIKLNAIRLPYTDSQGREYQLNLLDTPGHVDFTYEVSRSLAACEGALLVVDASQGIEAQTLSNLLLAQEHDLPIIPVLNKIDLPQARPEEHLMEICELLDIDPTLGLQVSAKEGTGIEQVLDAIVEHIPPPKGNPEKPLRGLIFDSQYDPYRGALPFVRVVDGQIEPGDEIAFGAHDRTYTVDEVGYMRLGFQTTETLEAGEVGWVAAQIKAVEDTQVGDTVLHKNHQNIQLLPGYKEVQPMVFAGLYPTDSDQFEDLREALGRLKLNDASLQFEPETSEALGFGFRCGFLGLLHMEIVQERLEREFDLDLITTLPNVEYEIRTREGEIQRVENPAHMPPPGQIEEVQEPYVRAHILAPDDYIGNLQKLCQNRRGEYVSLEYRDTGRVELTYELPLSEIVLDFYDRLKSVSRGFATLDYERAGYRTSKLVRMDILVNEKMVDALSMIVHRDKAYDIGRQITRKLKDLIPKQMFEVPLQAALGNNVIARETIRARKKNVTDKCYGGDITRKRKLWEQQKEGKKRMKKVGSVDIPQEAFMAVLELD